MLYDEIIAFHFEIHICAKPKIVVLTLGRGIDPSSLIPAEGSFLIIVGDDVLAKLRANGLQPKTQMTNDREIADDRVLLLNDIMENP